ncbi:NAD-dependent epimerase/dehydratase family protein [Acinetobacter puyangensis]|uniref:NAD-dependent epimerase/dehydratase domain-containing protein n=1 Tax=Acinetobacter puyangensis TaxID=1096779 RepID=A0A240E8U7_9GAMM|nr:dihydroflavonol-4-reductase/hypothetical protein [Acinetobacter puyangensis]
MTIVDKSKPILVTGATGYVAGWIIANLLRQGFTIHATVRNPANKKSIEHLIDIAASSSGAIHFFKANLLQPKDFDAAMQDCEIVIHTASPFVVSNYKDAVKDIIEPAIQGTKNVLESVNRTESVKRVVLTSSIAATYGDAIEILKKPDRCFDENDWNTTSSTDHQPYPYSKVAAEREAWKMQSEQSRWDLVCINPALVMGPSLTANTQSGSVEVLQQFGDGTTLAGVPPMWNGIVDVRDVADAHIAAAFTPDASGRYIISGGTLSLLEIGKVLKAHFGGRYPFPRFEVPKAVFTLIAPLFGLTRQFVKLNMGYPIYFNNKRSIDELGIQYRDIHQSLIEHFQQLIDDGIVKKR